MQTLIVLLIGSLLLAPGLATSAFAKKLSLPEQYEVEQHKLQKESEHVTDQEEREDALRMKLRKARQTRRSLTKNREDTLEIDEDIQRLKRESGVDDE